MKLKRILLITLALVTCLCSTVALVGCDEGKPATYTITFDAGEGTIVGESTLKVTYGKKIGVMPTAEKDGYVFIGWFYGNNQYSPLTTYRLKNDITLSAMYVEDNKCLVILDVNGGEIDGDYTREVVRGNPIGTLPTPTRDGYEFLGWFTDSDTLVDENTVAPQQASVTFTAKWRTYTVTLDLMINGRYLARYDADPNTDGNQTQFVAKPGEYVKNYLKGTPIDPTDEYAFEYWQIKGSNNALKKLDLDVAKFNSDFFGDSYEVTIYVKFRSNWIGPY